MPHRQPRPLAAFLVLVSLGTLARAEVRPPPRFGIGAGEADPRTHVALETPRGLTSARVRIVVDKAAPTGLSFFALEVDFANGTWAHGGVQDLDGVGGARARVVNWGGLVDRGGGDADYDLMDDVADLEKIQNPPLGQHVGPYAWKNGVAYEYVVERGARVKVPRGRYQLSPERKKVRVRHARFMWEWRLTVRPVSEPGEPFVATLLNSAATVDSISVWNESGYGSTDAEQHTSWWAPRFGTPDGGPDQVPSSWERF